MTEPYDHRANRHLTSEDLPEGVTLDGLKAFLAAHSASFYSKDHFTTHSGFGRDSAHFRIGVHAGHMGSGTERGVNALWQDVRDWVAKQPERDLLVEMRDKIADVIMIECGGRYAFGGFDHDGCIDDHGEGVLTFAMEPSDRGRAAGMRERLFKITVEEIGV